jgi:hypothetical protein
MNGQIGLMVNGPSEWYENIIRKFKVYGKTWLQQNKQINSTYASRFREIIEGQGYFLVFGYAQKLRKVKYLFHINNFKNDDKKTPSPDNTAPDFAGYDIEQGKCEPGRYKYKVWLNIIDCQEINPLGPERFINDRTGKPLNHRFMKPLHFYVRIPEKFEMVGYRKKEEIEKVIETDLVSLHEEEEFFEGKSRERFSNYYERKPKLRARAISLHGTKCMACNFDFEKKYGKHGNGFIEVHHLKPISELKDETPINPKTDMVVVCSNCHRMIHRDKNHVLSLEELEKIIQS